MERKRLDSRSRFQHANFTRKLQQARNYKRTSRPRPEDRLQAGLQKIGLASLATQILLAMLLVFVCYVFYVPNPLFVTKVAFEGMSIQHQTAAENAVKKFLKQQPWYVPSYNMLFIDQDDLAGFVAKEVPVISRITQVDKNWKDRSVRIKIVEKYERYLVIRPEDRLVLYNDGSVAGTLKKIDSDIPESGAVVTVIVNDEKKVDTATQYFDNTILAFIEQVAVFFPEQTGQNFSYFKAFLSDEEKEKEEEFAKLWNKAALEAVLVKKIEAGRSNPAIMRIVMEPGMDIGSAAQRLKLLLEQTPIERYRGILYVDMRLQNRAYLCLINTPCADSNP